MPCERCNERTATVHVKRVVNGERSEHHLCEACAKQQGEFDFHFKEMPFQSILAGFLQDLPDLGGMPTIKPSGESESSDVPYRCPQCGLTLQAFRKSGLLGCPECYKTFSNRLEPLLRRLHGAVEHKGRIPARGGVNLLRESQLRKLREELNKAIEEEAFERAAELRDKIRSLPQGGETT